MWMACAEWRLKHARGMSLRENGIFRGENLCGGVCAEWRLKHAGGMSLRENGNFYTDFTYWTRLTPIYFLCVKTDIFNWVKWV